MTTPAEGGSPVAEAPVPAGSAPTDSSGSPVVHAPVPAQVAPPPRSILPPRAPLFAATWPAPQTPPSRAVLVAAAVAGVTMAAAAPPDGYGVGLLVIALVLETLVLGALLRWGAPAGIRRPDVPMSRDTGEAIVWTLVAVALVGVAVLRDAQWLVEVCLFAACGAGSLAAGGRWFRSILVGAVAVPVAAVRALPWLGLVQPGSATADGRRRAMRLAASMLVTAFLLLVFGALLTSADEAFAAVVDSLLPTLDVPSVIRYLFLFAVGALGVLGAGFLLAAPPTRRAVDAARPRRWTRTEWVLPIGLLVVLFAMFVGVQFATLFGSDAFVARTTGLSYAEYARSGFWQLSAVTVLTFAVVVAGSRWIPADSPGDRAWKRGLLGGLVLLTLVIVASALSRMWLYQQAYGFTVLRLLVLACELWFGVGLLMMLWTVARLRAGRPGRGMVVIGAGALLALAALDPERFVAEHNVTRYEATGKIDNWYLEQLSVDAVPAVQRLPGALRDCTLASIALRNDAPDGDWRSWNAARATAEPALVDFRGSRPSASCDSRTPG